MRGWEKRWLPLDRCLTCVSSSPRDPVSSCYRSASPCQRGAVKAWERGSENSSAPPYAAGPASRPPRAPAATLGTELLLPSLRNGNRTACLASLVVTPFFQGPCKISHGKIFFEIKIIIQNLGEHISFCMVWFLCFPHSLPNFNFFPTLATSFSSAPNTENAFSFPALFYSPSVHHPISTWLPTRCLLSLSGNFPVKRCSLASFCHFTKSVPE